MSKVTIMLLLRLLVPSLICVSATLAPHTLAYADSDSDSDSDSGDSDGESNSEDGSDSSGTGSDHGLSGGKVGVGYWNKLFGAKPEKSHQRSIRKAFQRKQILSLRTIMRIIQNKTKSEIIGIDLEHKEYGWVYEFKIVDRKGRLLELYVDAKNGNILKTKSK